MQLYNTRSGKIEPFKPIKENEVTMYVCGPTVYNHAHIGNARPIVVFDLLRRVLEALGYQVTYVSNYTDVDDKIIAQAKIEHISEGTLTQRYIDAYQQVRSSLHTRGIDASPRVTQTMDEIIRFIGDLVDQDKAYVVGENVYFSVDSVPDYGTLSHQNLDQLRVGARIDENKDKRNPLDFVLWKNTTSGIRWASPWGEGRPGWHTECVVMIEKNFGGAIDIHGGGMDLRFPHHENEAAQWSALHHHDLAHYWVHNAMLNIDDEKMSKSLGNVLLAKDVIAQLGSDVTRWLLLSVHYRMTLNISDETITQAKTEVEKVKQALKQAYVELELNHQALEGDVDQRQLLPFLDALKDDLNSPNAIMAIMEEVKALNQNLRVREKNYPQIVATLLGLERMLDIFGISSARITLSDEDRQVFAQWQQAKADKDFARADQYRTQLQAKGYL